MREAKTVRIDVSIQRMTDLAVAHASRKEQLEWDVISSILADPIRGRCAVSEASLHVADFECLDMKLMFATVLVAADRGKLVVLRLIRRALQEIGHWDAQARSFERNTRWSDESLVNFATSYPNCSQTPALARRLIDLRRRTDQARHHWRRMVELLDASADPTGGGLVIVKIRNPKNEIRRPNRH